MVCPGVALDTIFYFYFALLPCAPPPCTFSPSVAGDLLPAYKLSKYGRIVAVFPGPAALRTPSPFPHLSSRPALSKGNNSPTGNPFQNKHQPVGTKEGTTWFPSPLPLPLFPLPLILLASLWFPLGFFTPWFFLVLLGSSWFLSVLLGFLCFPASLPPHSPLRLLSPPRPRRPRRSAAA